MRLFIDGHNDTMARILDENSKKPIIDIGKDTDFHIDLSKLKEGELNAPIFAAFSAGYYDKGPIINRSLNDTMAIINGLYFTEKNNQNDLKIVSYADEIEENYSNNKISAIPSLEGAYFIDEENYFEILRQLKDLKIKIIGFNWNYSNLLGEGVSEYFADEKTESSGGLTDLGIKSLKEMEKLGIAIDVSHMNQDTFWGVVKHSRNPIIATHSGAYSVTEHRRNLRDDQLDAIKESNGLVGVVLCHTFIREGGNATLEDFMRHLDYMIERMGVDHVGIGSDLDGTKLPRDLKDASEMTKIIELLESKYSREEVDKILGGNFLRVFREIEAREEVKYIYDEIDVNYEMGDNIHNKDLRITLPGDENKVRVIVDGIVKEEFVSPRNLELDFDIFDDERYHILTIESDNQGRIHRNTKIIRIN